MAGFEKGHKKIGGKQAGSQNKLTQTARELFLITLESQVPKLMDSFDKVRQKDDAKYLELFAKYAQYFVPKQLDVTTKGDQVKQVFKIGNVEIEL